MMVFFLRMLYNASWFSIDLIKSTTKSPFEKFNFLPVILLNHRDLWLERVMTACIHRPLLAVLGFHK